MTFSYKSKGTFLSEFRWDCKTSKGKYSWCGFNYWCSCDIFRL